MSSREDIQKGLLVYTCKGGWIDKNHALKTTTRPFIGADNLWKQIINETGSKSKAPGTNGFKVTYIQDATSLHLGITKHYCVKSGLPLNIKESVALAIFQEVSMLFEDFQGWGEYFGKDSSFSVEDLVSNLVGFYTVVRPGTDYVALCEPVSKEASLKIWDTFGSVGSHKNKKFEPVYFDCSECTAKGPFPKELQQIVPAIKTDSIDKPYQYFRDWTASDFGPITPPREFGPKY
ncbi:MAG: DUF4056 domain-containing protein [Acidobacteriota bacterium]